MTTTLRPTGPLQDDADGTRSRHYEVCVNSAPVGTIEIATRPTAGSGTGTVRTLWIEAPHRRRGRGTVAALAAEEVLRGWGCDRVMLSVPPSAVAATRLLTALGYTETGRVLHKRLAARPPALPPGSETRPMTAPEFDDWWERSLGGYAHDVAAHGLPPARARAKAESDRTRLLPQRHATPGVRLDVLLHQGTTVGHLLLGSRTLDPTGERSAYVYEVEVAPEHRRRGHGRTLMRHAERLARETGEERLALHVFAGNGPARSLYTALHYRPLTVHYAKPLL
ncbi:GNAT family N-acetyltransferase [Streptomyces sp. NPDC057638]|uniref:GNAT family N-acetyltransferase n=1 Tax=Streptomyces sp. NPDC057638 TaxID=3346190 RepID=UPI003692CD5E